MSKQQFAEFNKTIEEARQVVVILNSMKPLSAVQISERFENGYVPHMVVDAISKLGLIMVTLSAMEDQPLEIIRTMSSAMKVFAEMRDASKALRTKMDEVEATELMKSAIFKAKKTTTA